MSIADAIIRLDEAKASLKTSIENKGVSVPTEAKLDTYHLYVDQIQQGGGGDMPEGVTDFRKLSNGDTMDLKTGDIIIYVATEQQNPADNHTAILKHNTTRVIEFQTANTTYVPSSVTNVIAVSDLSGKYQTVLTVRSLMESYFTGCVWTIDNCDVYLLRFS